MYRDARRAGAPGRPHIALDRRRTVPEGLRAQRRRIGPLDTSFHARGIALPHTRHHRGARLAAAPPDADDVRTAPPAGRAGPRQRGIPPHRGLRPDPGRRGRSRRVGLVAVHHGAAARAAAGQARHLAACTRSGLDTLFRYDSRHGRALRHRNQPARLRGVLHPRTAALPFDLFQHRGRLERRGDAAGGGRHGRRGHRAQRLDALEAGRHGHLHRAGARRSRRDQRGGFGDGPAQAAPGLRIRTVPTCSRRWPRWPPRPTE